MHRTTAEIERPAPRAERPRSLTAGVGRPPFLSRPIAQDALLAGLLTATHQKGVRGYRGPSLELLRVIHAARLAGLGDLFTPAVLAPYVDAVRKLVALELDLFRARLASSAARPDAGLPKLARKTDALGERLLVVLRRQLLLAAVRSAPVSPARLPRRPRQK